MNNYVQRYDAMIIEHLQIVTIDLQMIIRK